MKWISQPFQGGRNRENKAGGNVPFQNIFSTFTIVKALCFIHQFLCIFLFYTQYAGSQIHQSPLIPLMKCVLCGTESLIERVILIFKKEKKGSSVYGTNQNQVTPQAVNFHPHKKAICESVGKYIQRRQAFCLQILIKLYFHQELMSQYFIITITTDKQPKKRMPGCYSCSQDSVFHCFHLLFHWLAKKWIVLNKTPQNDIAAYVQLL